MGSIMNLKLVLARISMLPFDLHRERYTVSRKDPDDPAEKPDFFCSTQSVAVLQQPSWASSAKNNFSIFCVSKIIICRVTHNSMKSLLFLSISQMWMAQEFKVLSILSNGKPSSSNAAFSLVVNKREEKLVTWLFTLAQWKALCGRLRRGVDVTEHANLCLQLD